MVTTVAIRGMTCGHCEGRVSKELSAIPGVIEVSASAEKAHAIIKCLLIKQNEPHKAAHLLDYKSRITFLLIRLQSCSHPSWLTSLKRSS